MTILGLFVLYVVVGVALWFVNTKVTFMDGSVKQLLTIVAILILILWTAYALGLGNALSTPLPKLG